MKHEFSESVRNSDIMYYIDEYVRKEIHREILKEWWFGMISIEALAEKHNMSVSSLQRVIYGVGDKILLMANENTKK